MYCTYTHSSVQPIRYRIEQTRFPHRTRFRRPLLPVHRCGSGSWCAIAQDISEVVPHAGANCPGR